MPDTIINLAAKSTVNENILKKEYYSNNVLATKNLVYVMNKLKIKKLIFSSTAAVYHKNSNKIKENYKLKPISKYGKSKLEAELIIKKNKNIKHVILRFFNVASSISKPIIGEFHNPETHLIPISVSNALKNKTINIFGDDYLTKDGTCIRDYIHIKDICLAIKNSKNYLKNKRLQSLTFNIGNGKGISNKQILSNLKNILKKNLKIQYLKKRSGDQPILVCNINRAKKLIKWQPVNSRTKKILKDEIKWANLLIKKNVNRKILNVQE